MRDCPAEMQFKKESKKTERTIGNEQAFQENKGKPNPTLELNDGKSFQIPSKFFL
jgi:hypothetical protein